MALARWDQTRPASESAARLLCLAPGLPAFCLVITYRLGAEEAGGQDVNAPKNRSKTETTLAEDRAREKLLWITWEMQGEQCEKFESFKTPDGLPPPGLELNSECEISLIKQTQNLSLEKQRFPAGDYVGLCLR